MSGDNSDDNGEDVKLSPQDVGKLKEAQAHLASVLSILNDIPDDVREEYGDLEDAISKAEEVDELIGACVAPEAGADNPA